MKKFLTKSKNLLSNKSGASNVEIIVWISVVLAIATILFLFKDSITEFIAKAKGKVDTFNVD